MLRPIYEFYFILILLYSKKFLYNVTFSLELSSKDANISRNMFVFIFMLILQLSFCSLFCRIHDFRLTMEMSTYMLAKPEIQLNLLYMQVLYLFVI